MAGLTDHQLLVRNIVAEILEISPVHITANSDFFLMGGNSLLLGQLSHRLRRQTGINIRITDIFSESTIRGIASIIDEKEKKEITEGVRHKGIDVGGTMNGYSQEKRSPSRSQNHPLCLIIQAIPFLFFYPLKLALMWSTLISTLSNLSHVSAGGSYARVATLLVAILTALLVDGLIPPLAAICFKWITIGRHRPGTYRMWSSYYLRWWIVNQAIRISDLGIFSTHPWLMKIYYQSLGARIGRGVHIDEDTRLYECDLLTLQDGCRLNARTLCGFCVERDGHFRLAPVTIGRKAFINPYTNISPGTNISDDSVYGPHSSSHDNPSPKLYAAYNRTLLSEPSLWLRIVFAWPIILIVIFVSYIPWILVLYAMAHGSQFKGPGLNDLEAVIYWFTSSTPIFYYALSNIVHALLVPLVRLALGIITKRILGLNGENSSLNPSQMALLRRYINWYILSEKTLGDAFIILGPHYEAVSVAYRAMGAKVGRRVYWPGGGIICPDPELLDIGDDVVFGSRSSLITTDSLGSGKIVIEEGAMVADRVVLLPGTRLGSGAVMGTGSLGKRNGNYAAGSIWVGNENGEALCLSKSYKEGLQTDTANTSTPFGRAFYRKEANYFVFPYTMVLAVGIFVVMLSAAYWSIGTVAVAQILRHTQILHFYIFRTYRYRLGVLYGVVALCFIIILSLQGILAMLWIIATNRVVIGQRQPGKYDWDQSNYCQRWNIHLLLMQIIRVGYGSTGVLAPLTGSAYIVWYFRALGCKIGRNCAIWAGGEIGLMTEPDLVELGDDVNLDDCSVVGHINSRGRFSLNRLKIGNKCAMRAGSRLLAGASMEDNSMLCEHTLLASGDIADSNTVYCGWPAKRLETSKSNSAAFS
ncbi:hypothetical protein BYT27DRAFT_7188280 [Phlegmacium glaucopus]|nr:hypothetical protein BYT27DRAFT_7188280 [Phlegmacium glaucopus]